MPDRIDFRAFADSDLPSTLGLLRTALGESIVLKRTPELFRWKHFDNPFGQSIIRIAELNGAIIGVRAFMRWELLTPDGQRLKCVRAVDTATHPDHRRRGILRQLTADALQVAKNEHADLVFNTPNQLARVADIAMGWQDVGPIGVMVRPSVRLLRRHAPDGLPDPEVILPGSGPAGDPSLPIRPGAGLRTQRIDAYLAWRFAHPTAPYRRIDIGEATAIVRANRRKGIDELVVSDVFGPSPEKALRRVARQSMAGYVVTWFSRGSPEWWGALRSGMVPIPGVTALRLVVLPLAELPVDPTDLGNWDLALSDLELL